MGKTKESSSQSQQSSSSTSYTPTPEETEFNKLQLAQAKEFDPIQRQLNTNAGNLINQLLLGQNNLPGFLSKLPGGIDEGVTDELVKRSLRDVNAQLSASGAGTFMDSGVAQSIGTRTAGDIRLGSEQFNIGNLLNLLNLAVGGQAQVQQPTLATSNMLSQRLAGLRTVNQSGSATGNTMSTSNPFMSSFYQSSGSGLGNIFNPQTYFKPCWVAAEIFGGWEKLQTRFARIYIMTKSPKWFKNLYIKYGESFSKIIHKNFILKKMITPLFEKFAIWGGYNAF